MFKVGYNTKKYRLDGKSYSWENLFIKSNQSILWNQNSHGQCRLEKK